MEQEVVFKKFKQVIVEDIELQVMHNIKKNSQFVQSLLQAFPIKDVSVWKVFFQNDFHPTYTPTSQKQISLKLLLYRLKIFFAFSTLKFLQIVRQRLTSFLNLLARMFSEDLYCCAKVKNI